MRAYALSKHPKGITRQSTKRREKLVHANLLSEAKTWITTEADILSSLTNNTDFPYPNCNPQLLYRLLRLQVAIMLNQPFSFSTLIGARIRVCCFCRSALTRSQRYSNFMGDTKMFLPKKMQCCVSY